MILGPITHPELLRALARAGHTNRILIADGHFPLTTAINPRAELIYLNLAPGLPTVPQVLNRICMAVRVEMAVAAVHEDGTKPAVWPEFVASLPAGTELSETSAQEFLALAAGDDVAIAVATGDLRSYACIAVTIGRRE